MEELNPFEKILGKKEIKQNWPEPETNDDPFVIPERKKPKFLED